MTDNRRRGEKHAYETGQAHTAYNWGPLPWGDWTDAEKHAYDLGKKGLPFIKFEIVQPATS